MLAFYWDIPGFLVWILVLRFDWTIYRGKICMYAHIHIQNCSPWIPLD